MRSIRSIGSVALAGSKSLGTRVSQLTLAVVTSAMFGRLVGTSTSGRRPLPIAEYNADPVWRSPVTLGVLQWTGVILGVLTLLPIARVFKPLFDILSGNGLATAIQIWAYFVLLLLFFCLALVRYLRHIVKNRLRTPLFPGWALSGRDGRVVLERIRAEGWPQCGREFCSTMRQPHGSTVATVLAG